MHPAGQCGRGGFFALDGIILWYQRHGEAGDPVASLFHALPRRFFDGASS